MKYIIRALKYFISLALILVVFIALLRLFNLVGGEGEGIAGMFRNGTDSIWQIALILLVLSAVYPRFGYGTRTVMIPGSYAEVRDGIVETMRARGYELEKEEGENLSFRKSGTFARLSRAFEDRITFTRCMTGFYVEGYSRDLVRVISALEYRFRGE